MSIDIEYLGSCVFEELAFNYLAYTSSLSECKVVDYYFNNDYDYYVNEAKKLVSN